MEDTNYLNLILSIVLIDYVLKFFITEKVINYGAAFDILEEHTPFLIVISFIALFVFVLLFFTYEEYKLGTSLLIAGTLSNLLDRILFGYVVDYIPFLDLFYFNVGDLSNFLGVLFLFYRIVNEPENEEERMVLKRDVRTRYKLKEK